MAMEFVVGWDVRCESERQGSDLKNPGADASGSDWGAEMKVLKTDAQVGLLTGFGFGDHSLAA